MTETYVIGYDGTDAGKRAVDFAAERARTNGAKLHLVHVLEWSPYSFYTPEELAERHKRREEELGRAHAVITPALEELTKAGVSATGEARHGHAGDLLATIAKEMNAKQIIVGRNGGTGLAGRLLGSLAITLAQASPVPVTIVP